MRQEATLISRGIPSPAQHAGPAMSRWEFIVEAGFNKIVTYIPWRRLRRAWLRLGGAQLAPDVSIFCGAQVLNPRGLRIGRRAAVGWRVVLDARGGIEMGDDVNVASDSHILTADHDARSSAFEARFAPVHLGDYTSIGTRCVVLKGVTVGRGGVGAAGAVITRDVTPSTIVAGVPAREIGSRATELTYTITPPPPLA